MSSPQHFIPIIFCVDGENDDLSPSRDCKKPWTALERCFTELGAYRTKLEAATGARATFTWSIRADTQLAEMYGDSAWGMRTYRRQLGALAALGDDIGLHPHPQAWSETECSWIGMQHEPEWASEILRAGTTDFVDVLGMSPRTLRFGNRFMSQPLADTAAALGFQYDLSVEPGYPGRDGQEAWHRLPGLCPDYFDIPRVPYRAAHDNFRVPANDDASRLWIVPMSCAPIGRNEDEAELLPLGSAPLFAAVGPARTPYDVLHLSMSPLLFKRSVDHLLSELTKPYLAMVIRCDMIALPQVWANLEFIRLHPRVREFEFTNCERVVAHCGYSATHFHNNAARRAA
jgi:hypothetical protein